MAAPKNLPGGAGGGRHGGDDLAPLGPVLRHVQCHQQGGGRSPSLANAAPSSGQRSAVNPKIFARLSECVNQSLKLLTSGYGAQGTFVSALI